MAYDKIYNSYYHPIGRKQRLTIPELDAKIAKLNAVMRSRWTNADPKKRDPNGPKVYTRADIANFSPAQKRQLGIAGTESPAQDVYMELVKMSIPAYKAYTMVKEYYPGFDPGNTYFPKVIPPPRRRAHPAPPPPR